MSNKIRIMINVALKPEEAEMLDSLIQQDSQLTGIELDRSKVVKRLIRLEYQRRQNTNTIITDMPCPEDGKAPILVGIR